MEHNEKKNYESPLLTVVSIHTERGFATSSATLDLDLQLFMWNNSDPHVTQYNEDDSWLDYSWD